MNGHPKPLRSIQGWIDRYVPKKKHRVKDLGVNQDLAPEIHGDLKVEIVGICEGIKREGRGELFKKLFHEGDWSSYPSTSEAEIDLLDVLAWAAHYLVGDEEERHSVIKAIFMESAFYRKHHRPQWDREGYLNEQVWEAIESCTSGYTGKPKEQVLRRLEALRIAVDWGGEMNACAVYGAHIALAYDHGRYVKVGEPIPGPKGETYRAPGNGPLVHSAARDLSLFSGVLPHATAREDGTEFRDYRNITKLNDKLEDMGLIKRIYKGTPWGLASLYQLLESALDAHAFSSITHKPDPHPSPHAHSNGDSNGVHTINNRTYAVGRR